MNPKDNIIETVPLSAIRKVIELDAQDARELRAVAVEMRDAMKDFVTHARLCNDDVGRRAIIAICNQFEEILKKAGNIL